MSGLLLVRQAELLEARKKKTASEKAKAALGTVVKKVGDVGENTGAKKKAPCYLPDKARRRNPFAFHMQ